MHSLFIAPLLFYVGLYGKKSSNNIWSVIGTVSLLAFTYHFLRIFYPREITSCVEENKNEQNNLLVIYLFHIIFVVPLLSYVGYYGYKSNNKVWLPLLILSLFLFTYHGFRYFYPRTIKENC